MTFSQCSGLPDISDFVFNVGDGFEYTLSDDCGCHKAGDSEYKGKYICAMSADLLGKS